MYRELTRWEKVGIFILQVIVYLLFVVCILPFYVAYQVMRMVVK